MRLWKACHHFGFYRYQKLRFLFRKLVYCLKRNYKTNKDKQNFFIGNPPYSLLLSSFSLETRLNGLQ